MIEYLLIMGIPVVACSLFVFLVASELGAAQRAGHRRRRG